MKKTSFGLLAVLFFVLLTGCVKPVPMPEPTSAPTATAEPTPEMTATPAPAPEPLKPLTADQLLDGTYTITVKSSSSMFRIVDAQLTVQDGAMYCTMTMSGQGYGMLYMGTGKEALADTADSYIPFVLDEDGAKTFTVPVAALNTELDCAAWSIKKEKWYDRTLVFKSVDIPTEAIVSE